MELYPFIPNYALGLKPVTAYISPEQIQYNIGNKAFESNYLLKYQPENAYSPYLYAPYTGYSNTNKITPVPLNLFRQPMTYRPVTAYTATQPIIVNGVNINAGLYPVLNYKPPQAQYPYIYVPIAEFSRVGAKVVWDETNMVLTVTTDYYTNLTKINDLERQIEALKSTCRLDVLSYEGLTEAQISEIKNLVGTKTLSEIRDLRNNTYNSADVQAKAKGKSLGYGQGYVGNNFNAEIWVDPRRETGIDYHFKLYTNDPNLEINMEQGKYTAEQLEMLDKYINATFYVILKDIIPRIQALP